MGTGQELEEVVSPLPPAARLAVGPHQLQSCCQQALLWRGTFKYDCLRRLINSVFSALGKFYCFGSPEEPPVFLFLLKLYLFISWSVSPIFVLQVMAIVPSHFVWKRVRSEHHSGAQRQYGDQEHTAFPRGPSASPLSCALCNRGTRLHQGPGFSSPSRGPSAQSSSPAFPHPFTSILSLEMTPPRASLGKTVETKIQAQHSSSCCVDEVPSRYYVNTCISYVNQCKMCIYSHLDINPLWPRHLVHYSRICSHSITYKKLKGQSFCYLPCSMQPVEK